MKKFTVMLLAIVSYVFAAANTDSGLEVKMRRDANLASSVEILEAEPILNISQKLIMRGESKADKNGNVKIRFDRIEYNGKSYDLSTPFYRTSKLKNQNNAVLKENTKLSLTGGSKQEILDILNNKKEPSSTNKATDNNRNAGVGTIASGGSSSGGGGYTSGGGGYTSVSPYAGYGSSGTDSSTGSTSNTEAATCKTPYIDGSSGIAIAWAKEDGACVEYQSNSIYEKFDTRTCKSKIDYTNNKIELGVELYATMDNGKEYKVQNCEFLNEIDLSNEIGSCKATPDYDNNLALIQKQYFYYHNGEKVSVGQCVPTDLKLPLKYDSTICNQDKHDFINKYSIDQAQAYYMADNKRYNVGECVNNQEVDLYEHFYDDTACEWQMVNDRVFYKQRVAYYDLLGQKQFATDCETYASGGVDIQEEFAGYVYQEQARQALRKVNKYFIVPGTTKKIYTDTDVVTSKAYPYQEESCGWEHNDTTKVSWFMSRFWFNDTDENVRVDLEDSCHLKTQIAYVLDGSIKETVKETLENKTVIFDGTGYKIYGIDGYLDNQPNYARNYESLSCNYGISSSTILSGGSHYQNSGNCLIAAESTIRLNPYCEEEPSIAKAGFYYSNICPFSLQINKGIASNEQSMDFFRTYLGEKQYAGQISYSGQDATTVDRTGEGPPTSHYRYNGTFEFKITLPNANNQVIDVKEMKEQYIRGDGSKFTAQESIIRYIAK
ncbi:MAG: hypothetical protein LBG21_01145 [Campylobacteraceae bacterium]|jgi:hypothetical protein|nr:hypothetical protein [Campylobacteraceae bacterium]